jgi:phosphatidylserine/phosphatidylglycerophosphate/cardiolipin synthase-like enzyme
MESARTVRAQLVVDADHYRELVVAAVLKAQVSLWIATANLKTMLIEAPIGSRARARGRYVSFFESLSDLTKRGVEVRVLSASPPSKPLAAELHRFRVTRRQCPRVHMKMIAIDGRLLYLGSANVTGAGLGAKGEGRRNFEMGILTDDESMLDRSQERFDRIWRGAECGACKLRRQCAAPLDLVTLDGRSKRARRSPSSR